MGASQDGIGITRSFLGGNHKLCDCEIALYLGDLCCVFGVDAGLGVATHDGGKDQENRDYPLEDEGVHSGPCVGVTEERTRRMSMCPTPV